MNFRTDWRDEKWQQRKMIAERLKNGMPKKEVLRILEEHKRLEEIYEGVEV